MISAAGCVFLPRLLEDFKPVSRLTTPSTTTVMSLGFMSTAVHHCSKVRRSADISFSGVSSYSSVLQDCGSPVTQLAEVCCTLNCFSLNSFIQTDIVFMLANFLLADSCLGGISVDVIFSRSGSSCNKEQLMFWMAIYY